MRETADKALDIFNTMMKTDYCSQWLGIELIEVREGYCKIKMIVKREMLNGFGMLHGGMAYAFADSAFAFASNSYGRVAVSIQGSMNFAKSAKEGDELMAEAMAISVTHKTADFDVTITKEGQDKPLYFFRGTVYRKNELISNGQ